MPFFVKGTTKMSKPSPGVPPVDVEYHPSTNRFSFVQDYNCEWHIVPKSKVKAWYDMLDQLSDPREYEYPEYAVRAGNISSYSFLDPRT